MCVHMHVYECIYVCDCVCVYVCMCVRVYMYVHAMVGVQQSENNPRCQSLPFLSFLVKQSQVIWPPRFWRNPISASRFPQAHWGYRCLRCSICSYIGSGVGTQASRRAQQGPSPLNQPSSSFVTLPYTVLPSILNYCK